MRIGSLRIRTRDVVLLMAAFLVLFSIYALVWHPPSPFRFRGVFLTICILFTVLHKLPEAKTGKVVLGVFTLLALTGAIYPMLFEDQITDRYFIADQTDVYVFGIFVIGLMGVLTRIGAGKMIITLLVIMFAYLLWGQYMPGIWSHKPLPLQYIVSTLYTDISGQGVFGSLSDISARLLSIFMVFAALLVASGLGDVFLALSCRIAGNATGGPAKVSIFASALFGMISGSAVSNVASTGCFTIPLMKRVGFTPEMAGTVEAIASSGGMIVPPIMGVAAFMMSAILGVPYLLICVAAIIPAFLWYYSLFLVVHFYGLSYGKYMQKWRPSSEEVRTVLRQKGHLILSLPAIIAALYYLVAAEQAALAGTVFLLILIFIRKSTRLNKEKVVMFLDNYVSMFGSLFVLIVALSMFIGGIGGTGVHLKIGGLLLGGLSNWFLIALVGAAFTLLLGMIVPPLATYLAAIAVIAPALGMAGADPIVVHIFVLYVATLAPITPPVALAAIVGAKIAGADPMKTSWLATKTSLPLWIVPFTLLGKSLLLGVGTSWTTLLVWTPVLCWGTFMFVLGSQGYLHRRLKTWERILAAAIGVMVLQPVADALALAFAGAGVLLVGYWLLLDRRLRAAKARLQAEG